MASLSPYNALTSITTPRSVTLLTPPESPSLTEDVPFRPKNDDTTSLRMRKSRHSHGNKRRKLNRACLSSEDIRTESTSNKAERAPRHSRSLPSLTAPEAPRSASKQESFQKPAAFDASVQKNRRWTLPSKAAATRSRTTTIAADFKPASITPPDRDNLSSPAMVSEPF
jgi:hypothetical protein